MTLCPRCKTGKMDPYSDSAESWAIHLAFWPTVFRAIEAKVTGMGTLDILKCSHCCAYGFKCGRCSHVETTDNNIKHNDKRICSQCRREFIMRNPSNFLSTS